MLQGNLLTDAGLVALLAQAPMLRLLQMLSLACNDLTSVAAEALAEALAGGALCHLKLHDNSLGPSGAIPLAHLASTGQLQMLGLRSCALEDHGVLTLGESLRGSTLEVLDLEKNHLTDASALMFADLLSVGPSSVLQHLVALSLRSNAISDQGAAHLLRACGTRQFRLLDLGRNRVSDGTMQTLAELLESSEGAPFHFGDLGLGTNDVSDVGFLAFSAALHPGRGTVGSVNLTSNRLTSVSLTCIAAAMQRWGQADDLGLPLAGLDVTYNDASVESILAFRSALATLSLKRPEGDYQSRFTAGCG